MPDPLDALPQKRIRATFSTYVPRDTIKAVDAIAKAAKLTRSEIVTAVLESWLSERAERTAAK